MKILKEKLLRDHSPPFIFISFVHILSLQKRPEVKRTLKKNVDSFMQYPDEIKKKANAKLLIPFFVVLFIVFGLAMFSLKN